MPRQSRWGPRDQKVDLEPVANLTLTAGQLNAYVTHIRLDEISKKLKAGEIYPTWRDRSPSPEPIYDAFGKRMNGREDRYRKRLEDERARLIELTIRNNPELNKDIDHQTYLDYVLARNRGKKGVNMTGGKPSDKVWIPQDEYPHINFIGLLIGPRGNTLKKMEADTGAKISIRGKGSAKEGKMDAASLAAADEPLHAFVSGDTMEKVEKAIAVINKIIEHAASTPEEDNELKRNQLRELALLNGTLRDEDMIVCSNCGQPGHRRFECKESRNITNNLICRICGGAGHMAVDCLHRDNPEMLEISRQRSEHIDQELSSFLSQIGGSNSSGMVSGMAGQQSAPAQQAYQQQGYQQQDPYAQSYNQVPPPYANAAAPWAQPDPNAVPAPWAQPADPAAYPYPPNPWAMPPPPPPPPQ